MDKTRIAEIIRKTKVICEEVSMSSMIHPSSGIPKDLRDQIDEDDIKAFKEQMGHELSTDAPSGITFSVTLDYLKYKDGKHIQNEFCYYLKLAENVGWSDRYFNKECDKTFTMVDLEKAGLKDILKENVNHSALKDGASEKLQIHQTKHIERCATLRKTTNTIG